MVSDADILRKFSQSCIRYGVHDKDLRGVLGILSDFKRDSLSYVVSIAECTDVQRWIEIVCRVFPTFVRIGPDHERMLRRLKEIQFEFSNPHSVYIKIELIKDLRNIASAFLGDLKSEEKLEKPGKKSRRKKKSMDIPIPDNVTQDIQELFARPKEKRTVIPPSVNQIRFDNLHELLGMSGFERNVMDIVDSDEVTVYVPADTYDLAHETMVRFSKDKDLPVKTRLEVADKDQSFYSALE